MTKLVELSAGFIAGGAANDDKGGLATRITYYVRTPGVSYSASGLTGTGSNARVLFRIYKGTMPTGWLATPSTRDSDLLFNWIASSGTVGYSVALNSDVIQYYTTYITGTAGTATWFMLLQYSTASGTDTPYQQIYGSVGAIGSGSDLEMASTTIVSGRYYRISKLNLKFPSSWSVPDD